MKSFTCKSLSCLQIQTSHKSNLKIRIRADSDHIFRFGLAYTNIKIRIRDSRFGLLLKIQIRGLDSDSTLIDFRLPFEIRPNLANLQILRFLKLITLIGLFRINLRSKKSLKFSGKNPFYVLYRKSSVLRILRFVDSQDSAESRIRI